MYQVPVRFSSGSVSDRRDRLPPGRTIDRTEWRTRSRAPRSRRYLLYAGLLVGFCILLAFAGCGATAGTSELKAAVTAIDFGPVTVGQTSTANVSFTNSGAGAVQVSAVTVTGQSFNVLGVGSFPLTIAAGSTLSFQIQFSPSSTGTASGQVTLVSNVNVGGVPTVSLSGLGIPSTQPAPPASGVLSGISCTSSSMVGSGADNCFVALNGAAGSGGVTVGLTSSSAAVSVPATVTVPANTTGVGFTATVAAVATSESAVVTATQDGVSESFALQLNAALRVLSASASQVSFGYVVLNSTETQSVVLTSSGTQPVTIESVSPKGSGFSIGGLGLPVVLNPGQAVVLNVEFAPAATGSVSGRLTITTNGSNGPTMVITLSGTGAGSTGGGGSGGGSGTGPAPSGLSCSSASLTGAGTDNCNVTLSAAAPGGGIAVTLTSSNPALAVPASVTVPGGAVSAGFSATAAAVTAAQSATLTATANGSSRSFIVQLNAAGALLSPSQSTVSFGTVSLNGLGTQTLVLTSAGTLPVTISGAALIGSAFTMTGLTTPVTLNPGQSVALDLQFLPTAAGVASGQITITSNATAGGTLIVALTGTGALAYQVNLTWNPPASSADPVAGYNVYRSLNGTSTYQLLNSTATPGPTFTDTTALSGQSYVYYVTSVDSAGMESIPSNAFDASIP